MPNAVHYELPRYEWPPYTSVRRTTLGCLIYTVNFRADPNKRGKDWIEAASRQYSKKQWRQEFENDWTISSGKPVFEDYDTTKHVAPEIIRVEPNLPLYIGIDVGLYPGFVFLQETTDGQVRVLRCCFGDNIELVKFAPRVIETIIELNIEARLPDYKHTIPLYRESMLAYRNKYGNAYDAARKASQEAMADGLQLIFIGDPAGNNRQATDGKTNFQLLNSYYGISVRNGVQQWSARWNAVTSWLIAPDLAEGVPKFVISPHESTERLRTGFGGAYVWSPSIETTGKEEPLKNKFSHVQDALQYVATILNPMRSTEARGERETQTANMGNLDYIDTVFGRANPYGLPHKQHVEQMASQSIALAENAGTDYNGEQPLSYKLSIFSPPPSDEDEDGDTEFPLWKSAFNTSKSQSRIGIGNPATRENPFAPRAK